MPEQYREFHSRSGKGGCGREAVVSAMVSLSRLGSYTHSDRRAEVGKTHKRTLSILVASSQLQGFSIYLVCLKGLQGRVMHLFVQDCCNKVPQTGWLEKKIDFFFILHFLYRLEIQNPGVFRDMLLWNLWGAFFHAPSCSLVVVGNARYPSVCSCSSSMPHVTFPTPPPCVCPVPLLLFL